MAKYSKIESPIFQYGEGEEFKNKDAAIVRALSWRDGQIHQLLSKKGKRLNGVPKIITTENTVQVEIPVLVEED